MKTDSLFSLKIVLAVALPVALISLSLLTACTSTAKSEISMAESSSTQLSQSMSLENQYQPELGTYTVAEVNNVTLRTPGGRELPLKIYYPQSQGSFPTIIFSHGTGASKEDYAALGRYWASHGYVSIHPSHADSLSLSNQTGNSGDIREMVSAMIKDSGGWVERAKDISLIIDSFSTITQQAPQLQGKIDPNRVGVGGHSYGAYTAQLIGGATITLPGANQPQSLADRRVKAVLLLSPQGRGQQGLTDSSWKGFTLPMMVMTGSKDQGAQGQGPEWKQEPFDFAPAGNKYFVFIQGANHFSFSGRLAEGGGSQRQNPNQRFGLRWRERRTGGMASGGNQQAIFDDVKIASLAFWDAYLKQETQAKTYLKSNALADYSQGQVSIQTK